MRLSQQRESHHRLNLSFFLVEIILVLVCVMVIRSFAASSIAMKKATVSATLPGQQIWKQGISSYVFGTNDTHEWKAQNIETESSIQADLKQAGFTLLRSFFSDNASDTSITQRIQTIQNIGANCLGVITNISNPAYNEHLVSYLGNRCLMYEFGNEPDYSGISIGTYLQQWNTTIPLLRKLNPHAKFMGPVTHSYLGDNNFMQDFLSGVKASGVLPDAISFHWYPCFNNSEQACLSKSADNLQQIQSVQNLVQSTLGTSLPVGISEWNYDPENPPPAYGDNPNFIKPFTNNALQAMVQAGVAFACQFDAASYAGQGRLDMFDLTNDQPKPQYYTIQSLIQHYRPARSNAAPTATATTKGRLAVTLLWGVQQAGPLVACVNYWPKRNKRNQKV